jgi:hypothetical protein
MGTYESSTESEVGRDPGKESPGVAQSLSNPDVQVEQIPNSDVLLASAKEFIANLPLKISNESITHPRLIEIRRRYRRANEPWSDAEDDMLKKLLKEKHRTEVLSEVFQRLPGSITSRIRKLSGV